MRGRSDFCNSARKSGTDSTPHWGNKFAMCSMINCNHPPSTGTYILRPSNTVNVNFMSRTVRVTNSPRFDRRPFGCCEQCFFVLLPPPPRGSTPLGARSASSSLSRTRLRPGGGWLGLLCSPAASHCPDSLNDSNALRQSTIRLRTTPRHGPRRRRTPRQCWSHSDPTVNCTQSRFCTSMQGSNAQSRPLHPRMQRICASSTGRTVNDGCLRKRRRSPWSMPPRTWLAAAMTRI